MIDLCIFRFVMGKFLRSMYYIHKKGIKSAQGQKITKGGRLTASDTAWVAGSHKRNGHLIKKKESEKQKQEAAKLKLDETLPDTIPLSDKEMKGLKKYSHKWESSSSSFLDVTAFESSDDNH